jgi:hypothetical protein
VLCQVTVTAHVCQHLEGRRKVQYQKLSETADAIPEAARMAESLIGLCLSQWQGQAGAMSLLIELLPTDDDGHPLNASSGCVLPTMARKATG